MAAEPITQQETIDAIKALTEVVKANSQWVGVDAQAMIREANNKILSLIKKLDA